MKASNLFLLGTLVLALFMAVPAMAQPVTFTGDVEKDFPEGQDGVLVIVDPGNPGGIPGEIMGAGGNVSGWDIKDLRLAYDATSDTLYVGLNSFGTVGDVDGNGCSDTSDDPANFPENPNLCEGEIVAVYLDLDMLPEVFDNIQSWDIVAGVRAGVCNDGFVVAESYKLSGASPPPDNFGPPLEVHFNPDDDPICPSLFWQDYEFTILNFSVLFPTPELIYLNLIEFRVGAYMGSPVNGENIEDFLYHHQVPVPEPEHCISIEKVCEPQEAAVGVQIAYHITIENCSTPENGLYLENVEVYDPLLDPIYGPPLPGFPDTLAPGESHTEVYIREILSTDPDPLVNTATVQAKVVDRPDILEQESEPCETVLVYPGIDLEKTVDNPNKCPGDTTIYTICIKNTGDVPLENFEVHDTLLCPIYGCPLPGFPDVLNPGEEWCEDFSYVVPEDVPMCPEKLENCAVVTSNPIGLPDVIEDLDFADICCSPPPPGDEGCTPGFWKNSPGCWERFDPSDSFSSVFGVVITVRVGGKKTKPIEDPTLMQALSANGSGINALARHAVGALLNACNPYISYPLTMEQVIASVQTEVPDGDIKRLKNKLASYSEGGCPVNQFGECVGTED